MQIQCRTVLRHRFDFTFRSEDKYFRSEQVQFDGIQKVHGIRLRIIQNFLDGTQPFSSSPSSSLPPPSLYFQCAAKPCSATSFIRSLRICTSIHWPCCSSELREVLIAVGFRMAYPVAQAVWVRFINLGYGYVYVKALVEFFFRILGQKMIRTARISYISSNVICLVCILFQME